MTVKNLIEELSKLNPNDRVVVCMSHDRGAKYTYHTYPVVVDYEDGEIGLLVDEEEGL